jgi:chromosome segregation protein
MRDIELHAASHRWLELHAAKKLIEGQISNFSTEERATYDAVVALEERIASRRTALETGTAELEALASEVYGLEAQAQLDAQNLGHWNEDLAATRTRVTAAEAELATAIERKTQAEQDKANGLLELDRMGVASKEDEVMLTVKEEQLRRATELIGEITVRLESERNGLVELATRVANHEGALANLEQRKVELATRSAKVAEELATLTAEESQLEAARAEVLDRVEQHRAVALELTTRRGEEEQHLQRVRETFAENEVMVIALREELSDKRSRLSSLDEIQRNYDGFDRGVRAVMVKAGTEPRQQGVFGLVSDIVTAPVEFEKAIEAALGERLQHVIVESPERGYEFVEYLRGLAEGRSTFVPVPVEPTEPLPAVTGDDVLGMALSHVSLSDEVLRPLIAQLLSGMALVRDLDTARRCAAVHPAYTFVTVDGEVVRPGGVVTGGLLEGPAVGALQKKREVAELQLEVARVEERYNEIITRHYELQKQAEQLDGVLRGLEKNRHAEEISLTSHEKDLHQAGSSLSKLRDRMAGLRAELSSMEDTKGTLEFEVESARGEAAHGQADREARDERVRMMTAELETLKAESETLQVDTTGLKVKVASVSERGEAARQRVDALSAQVDEITERVGRIAQGRDEGLAHIATLEGRIAESATEREGRHEKAATAHADLEAKKTAHAEATGQVRDDENALRELRTKVDSLSQGLSSVSLKDRELTLEIDHVATQVQERYGLAIVEAVHQYHSLPPLSEEAQEKLKELRAQLERMGEVNVTAIEEHQEIAQRFEFLSKQKKDLEDSLSQLKDAIAKIDETSRVRFKETFDIVNEKFQAVFPRLFGGGRASLMLVQGGPGEEPGVEILAQPPGKKLQSMSLFSGGEKALTAVALIFAIFLIKPTPFCLLDEVDAPLDEGNVGRYNEMVREMSKGSQFILITHNKRTMEVVDSLYGVTMEEPGVSKLVSVKLREATAKNTDVQVA